MAVLQSSYVTRDSCVSPLTSLGLTPLSLFTKALWPEKASKKGQTMHRLEWFLAGGMVVLALGANRFFFARLDTLPELGAILLAALALGVMARPSRLYVATLLLLLGGSIVAVGSAINSSRGFGIGIILLGLGIMLLSEYSMEHFPDVPEDIVNSREIIKSIGGPVLLIGGAVMVTGAPTWISLNLIALYLLVYWFFQRRADGHPT